MIDETLEFRISQYADGTLPAAEVADLEAILASDAEARALLDEYRKLDVVLKRETPVLPRDQVGSPRGTPLASRGSGRSRNNDLQDLHPSFYVVDSLRRGGGDCRNRVYDGGASGREVEIKSRRRERRGIRLRSR